ncbi:unnamed protein product [Blepharisma stoltei]|uniref:BTB domain-containing protein n=1 Tax=Blepharisma stoltei TaxID=1481888 RepID=A0AAU9K8C2_9CILI|nr:unnamed protein product [Blepharisma stoltei]
MEKVPEQRLGLQSFAGKEFLADVTLSVGDANYKAHKIVLAAASEYFYRTFQDPSKNAIQVPEPIEPKTAIMRPKDVFPTILKYIYSNQSTQCFGPDNLNATTGFTIFSMAHILEIQSLVEYTGHFIADSLLNAENGADILYEGIKYDSKSLISASLEKIIQNFELISRKPSGIESLTNLPCEYVKLICQSNELNVKSEGIVYAFICSYLMKRENLEVKEEIKKEEEKSKAKEEGKKEESKKKEAEEEKQPQAKIEDVKEIAKNKLEIKKLTDQDKLELLEKIRWPFLTHAELLQAATNQLIAVGKDLVLEGLSVQLSAHEKGTVKPYSYRVSRNPRKSYKDLEKPETKEKVVDELNDIDLRNPQDEDEKQDIPQAQTQKEEPWNWPTQLLRQSLPTFNPKFSPPKPPQKFAQSFRLPNEKNKLENPTEFVYSYDFDENGAIYFLATNGKSTAWANPHISGQVQVFASSIGYGRLEDFVGRSVTNLRTLNEIGSFFGIDFGPGKLLMPTSYTIRNRNSSSHVCLNWQLEGSVNKTDWTVLDRRIHYSGDIQYDSNLEGERQALKQRGATSTWGIELNANDLKIKGYRCFRIVQIDRNSSGSYNLALSGFEIYGYASGKWI